MLGLIEVWQKNGQTQKGLKTSHSFAIGLKNIGRHKNNASAWLALSGIYALNPPKFFVNTFFQPSKKE